MCINWAQVQSILLKDKDNQRTITNPNVNKWNENIQRIVRGWMRKKPNRAGAVGSVKKEWNAKKEKRVEKKNDIETRKKGNWTRGLHWIRFHILDSIRIYVSVPVTELNRNIRSKNIV